MISSILDFLFGTDANGAVDRTALWTGVTALAAIVAGLVAWIQLGGAAKTTRADFAKRFVDSFFTEDTRRLFTLLMNSALEFRVLKINDTNGKKIDELPFFEIKKDIAAQLKGIVFVPPEKTGYSAFEVDDFLLGHFDDIGWYNSRNLIDVETIREMFGYYIYECYRNAEIQKYLESDCNEGKYKHFRHLGKVMTDSTRKR